VTVVSLAFLDGIGDLDRRGPADVRVSAAWADVTATSTRDRRTSGFYSCVESFVVVAARGETAKVCRQSQRALQGVFQVPEGLLALSPARPVGPAQSG